MRIANEPLGFQGGQILPDFSPKKITGKVRLSGVIVARQAHDGQAGRPAQGQFPSYNSFHLQAAVVPSPPAIGLAQRRAGRFILATNGLGATDFTASPVLVTDKDQQALERGCRFLKDPLFFTSSLFLKTPSPSSWASL